MRDRREPLGHVYIGAGGTLLDRGMCRVERVGDADGFAGPGTRLFMVETMIGSIAVVISDVLHASDMERLAQRRIAGGREEDVN